MTGTGASSSSDSRTSNRTMTEAFIAGTVAAVLCAVVGWFVVVRGVVFAADALTHVGFAGAAGAVLVGAPPIAGLLTLTIAVSAAIGALQERLRGRDVVVGMILVGALGLGVLMLRLSSGYSNQTYALLFGDILALSGRDLMILGVAAGVALAATLIAFRPLLFASLDGDLAEARGLPVRAVSIAFMLLVAIAASAATQVLGALLAVALIVAPAASAQRLTDRPLRSVSLAVGLALVITWAGLGLGYWLPYPVSFFITSLAAITYGLSRAVGTRVIARAHHARHHVESTAVA